MNESREVEVLQKLGECLAEHPALAARVAQLLVLVEGGAGARLTAAAAEDRVGEALRQLGQATLQASGNRNSIGTRVPGSIGRKKKLAWYTRYGAIKIQEQRYRVGRSGAEVRPLCGGGGDWQAGIFGAVAARAGGFWGGGLVWTSRGARARTLWN